MTEGRSGPVLVELIRLTVVVAATAAGYQVARGLSPAGSQAVALGPLLGCGVGYVAGGVLGRAAGTLIGGAERRIAKVPGADLVAGGIGMLAGIVAGAALGWPFLLLPARSVAVPVVVFAVVVFGSLGFRIGVAKREDLLQLFGLAFRTRAADLRVLDASAILDVRLLDCVRSGFLRGTMLVSLSVLEEVQSIADSSDPVRRQRGRRGLETLTALKREGLVDVRVEERIFPEFDEVDAKVVALARERGAAVVTNDLALARVAELQGIEVLSIAGLASSLRPSALPGESVRVDLVREGRQPGQAVGYLEDGSMVVVEGARGLVGENAEIVVTSVVQTAGGRMLFARPAGPRPLATGETA
ncbi:MAG: hypothetical protein HY775_02135 [Acidobacteria bacterium]|nr:hypothetical protein [Acidobacteriota bacterium]